MQTAMLFKSQERFPDFKHTLDRNGVDCIVLDFADNDWL